MNFKNQSVTHPAPVLSQIDASLQYELALHSRSLVLRHLHVRSQVEIRKVTQCFINWHHSRLSQFMYSSTSCN